MSDILQTRLEGLDRIFMILQKEYHIHFDRTGTNQKTFGIVPFKLLHKNISAKSTMSHPNFHRFTVSVVQHERVLLEHKIIKCLALKVFLAKSENRALLTDSITLQVKQLLEKCEQDVADSSLFHALNCLEIEIDRSSPAGLSEGISETKGRLAKKNTNVGGANSNSESWDEDVTSRLNNVTFRTPERVSLKNSNRSSVEDKIQPFPNHTKFRHVSKVVGKLALVDNDNFAAKVKDQVISWKEIKIHKLISSCGHFGQVLKAESHGTKIVRVIDPMQSKQKLQKCDVETAFGQLKNELENWTAMRHQHIILFNGISVIEDDDWEFMTEVLDRYKKVATKLTSSGAPPEFNRSSSKQKYLTREIWQHEARRKMFRLQDPSEHLRLVIVSEYQAKARSLAEEIVLRSLKKSPKEIAIQICQAMRFLHSKNIIHQDLRANNILLDRKHNIKIADSSIQCIKSLIPHRFTVRSRYKYICEYSIGTKVGCSCLFSCSLNESKTIDNPHGTIACKPGSIVLKNESVFHYAPELFEQMFLHGSDLQKIERPRWSQGLHSGTTAAESKLIESLRLVYNEKTDLFAFGTILFHLFSGHLPWYNHNKTRASLTNEQVILFRMIHNKQIDEEELQTPIGTLKEALKPSFVYLNCCDEKVERVRDVEFASDDIWSVINRCWKPESKRLDTFEQIQERLEVLVTFFTS